MAAATPESGTGTTTSASAGHSRASSRPSISLDSETDRPNTYESGREKYTCSNTQYARELSGANRSRVSPSGPAITISPGATSSMYTAPSRSNAQVSEANT